jgi:hypothetical protein
LPAAYLAPSKTLNIMKLYLHTALCWAFLLPFATAAQNKDVNEKCSGTIECKKGLYCVETVNGKKCASCDQSTLNSLTGTVNSLCKTFESGWAPDKSPEYKAVEAEDKRVAVEVYDDMLEKAKACKAARENRENKCWKGGDNEHKKAIGEVEASIKKISEHKYTMIAAKRVYYSSYSTYRAKLSTFLSKTRNLNIKDIENAVKEYRKKLSAAGKINCRQAAEYQKQCEAAYDAAKELLSNCFKNTESVMPAQYTAFYKPCEKLADELEEILKTARDKKLCE